MSGADGVARRRRGLGAWLSSWAARGLLGVLFLAGASLAQAAPPAAPEGVKANVKAKQSATAAPASAVGGGGAAAPSAAPASPSPAPQPRPKAASMDALLDQVQSGTTLSGEQKRREEVFMAAKGEQEKLLAEAKAEEAAALQQSEALEKAFDAGETRLAEVQEVLKKRMGSTAQLFEVVRQMAGECRVELAGSLTSAQLRGRGEWLGELARRKELPSIEQIEKLWFLMQQEMIESGKVVRFAAPVVTAEGETVMRPVVRVGAFNVVAGGKYLQWLPEVEQLAELDRQPGPLTLETVTELDSARGGFVPFALDPSRGVVLSLAAQAPTFGERLALGGKLGNAILALGALASALGLVRLLTLAVVAALVAAQRRRPGQPSRYNPLGRVLLALRDEELADVGAVERKLEATLRLETAKLGRLHWLLAVAAVSAPCLGLVGTVAGLIQTLHSVALFGSWDAKLTAGGFSEALVPSLEGLVVAAVLVAVYGVVRGLERGVRQVLRTQSAGLLVTVAEQSAAANPRGAEAQGSAAVAT